MLNPHFSPPSQAFFIGRDESNLLTKQLSSNPVVTMEQIHGARCQIVTEPHSHRVPQVDALLTTIPDLFLVVRTADCLPILLHHPSGLIGVIHAGRQGTQLGILRETLRLVQRHHGITEGLSLWFGPSICQNCYQINRDTDQHFDLIAENAAQAVQVFAPEKIKITATPHCTCHEPEQFYSYRREGRGVPMNYAGISLPSNLGHGKTITLD